MSYPPNQPSWGQPNPDEPQQGQGYPPPYQPEPPAPQYGQPYPGQPAPEYPQPDYAQPQSGAPQFGAPQFGAPQFGAAGFPPPPAKKSNTLKVVLIVLAAVVLLCVAGVVVVAVAAKDGIDQVNDAIEATSTTAPATPTTPAAPARTITLVEPAKLGGRPKLTDPQFADAAKGLKESLADAPGATDAVGGMWGDPADPDIVMAAAAKAPIKDPKREISGLMMGAGVGGMKLTGLTDVEPGPLGGEAKCGNTSMESVKMAVCVWTDNDSFGMIAWFFQSANKVKGEFAKLRGQIEKSE
jgi:hypothetical protein